MVGAVVWWLLACTGKQPEDSGSAVPGTTPDTDCACPEPAETDTQTGEFGGWPTPSVEILIPGSVAIGPTIVVDVRVYDLVFVGAPIGDETLDGGGTETGKAELPRGLLLTPLLPVLGLSLDALVPTAQAHNPQDRPAGYVRVRLDGVVVAEEPATRFRLEGVTPGPHLVEAEVVWADGDAFFPPVLDARSFEVQ